ncbi:MAG TPA: O-methyltransferase [Nitrososphaerales archaeon]|nr:O-methyltransferase [Nitrososphaerales archaeon]
MKPEEVLESIEKVAPGQGWPIIGPERGEILDEVVVKHKPSTILEVGTLVGYSAIRMGRHLKKGQKITCVELSENIARTARANFDKAGLSDRIEVVVGDAKKVLPTLKGSFDMVFIDAEKVEYLTYLKSVERLLHKGSVVIADNVRSHAAEVSDYLEYVRDSGNYKSDYRDYPVGHNVATHNEGDAVEVSVRL